MQVGEAIAIRRSVRGFTNQNVDLTLIKDIVTQSARAASGGNVQPWHIDIVSGDAMARLKTIMADKIAASEVEHPAYAIYPEKLTSPYRDRRFAVGEAMYAHIGIPREDKAARRRWFARNFQFFGAPVALFCTVDRQMGPPQWSDLGMFLTNVMLLCVDAGLASCPQECWAMYPDTITGFLGTPDNRMVFCGMAIGYEDTAHPANALHSDRADSAEWMTVHI